METTGAGDIRMTYRFRQSWLNTFAHCPEQARRERNGELDRTETDSMVLGTAVHAAIEYVLDSELHGQPLHADDPYDVIDHTLVLHAGWEKTRFTPENVRAYAHAAYDKWDAHIRPQVRPLAVEHNFTVPFPHTKADVELTGTIDCIDENGFVWDWKTASRSYAQTAWEYQRWAIQPTVYCFATDLTDFRYGVMVHGGEAETVEVQRTETHFRFLAHQIDRIVDLIEADLPHWPLNDQGWWCSERWCGAWADCKGKALVEFSESNPAKEGTNGN